MKFYCLFIFICWTFILPAQSPLLESISIEQGLSQGFVPSICQDDDGFLWFATKNGLNRYDGYNFKVFRNDPFDPLSLPSNELIQIKSAGDFIYVFATGGRPLLFHRQTHRFFRIPDPDPAKSTTLLYAIASGKNSIIEVVGNETKSVIYRITWPSNISTVLLNGTKPDSICTFVKIEKIAESEPAIRIGISDENQSYWVLTHHQLIKIDAPSGIKKVIPLPSSLSLLPSNSVFLNPAFPDVGGATWVFRGDVAARYDGPSWEVFKLPFTPDKYLFADRKTGLLWMSKGNQLYSLDLTAKPFNPGSFRLIDTGKPLISGLVDQSGNLWFGTDAMGILKFSPRSGAFRNYLEGYSIYCQPVFNERHHVFLPDVRRKDEGPRILDINNGKVEILVQKGIKPPPQNRMAAAGEGCFWWTNTTKDSGTSYLVRYDPEKRKLETIALPENIHLFYPALKFADPGQVWIFSGKAILKYEVAGNKFFIYKNENEPFAEIFAVERSPDGSWWLGTLNGLIKAVPDASGKLAVTKFTAEKGNRNSLSTNSIKSLLIDPAEPGILWIGTNGGGMDRMDLSTRTFKHFNTSDGVLPDDVVYGILAEYATPQNGGRKLWISTNRGLTRFTPETGFSQFFNKSDGLQDNEFNTHASFRSPSGELFFGGVNGLTVFNPKNLTVDSKPPSLRITSLMINGLNVNPDDSNLLLKKDIAFVEQLEFSHSQNNITLQFAAMDFSAPGRNQFAYYLEGAEEPWIHRGFDHSAQYLNLAPGTYVFKLKASNSFGVWTNKPISLEITIHAPWYLTWPAYLVYFVIFILAGYLFNQYQLTQRLKSAESKRLKNLDQFKNRFYTNITHEFRTPLTVILGLTERLISKNKSLGHPLTLIKRNGENLLRLINQILDLAKLESHDLKINYVQGDVLVYLRYISESLHSLANAQNVMLRLTSPQGKIIMDYDPERLLQIIHNLLSNAIKFTPSGGKVNVMAIMAEKKLTITVSDTGIGIPAAELPYIFDRFFQVKMQESNAGELSGRSAMGSGGTGIGLALTKELIQAMGGGVSVASPAPGHVSGTVFTVKLPVTNEASLIDHTTYDSPANNSSTDTNKMPGNAESGTSILLIEDNPDVMEYLASCLGTFRLEFAFNGRAGIEKALEIIPDLIISDVMMPEKDGFEVCDFLKNDERTSHIPIVLLTAKVTMEARIAGLKRGADAYLSKPFHEEELLVWVEQLIARKRMLHARYANLSVNVPAESAPDLSENLVLEDAFVVKFKSILDENYQDSDISAESIAMKMGMSRAQLYRKLSSLTGRSVTEHLNTVRLEKAKELLKAGNLNISEVAYRVGYNDPKYFGRLFSEAFGVTPSEFAAKSNV
jgi:signal transduction histidine kinase/CheY-like chemotaxis protein/ligand-binding sensor domain-containing protein